MRKTMMMLAVASGLATGSGLGQADTGVGVSGNVGVASNYLWRGTTQTDDRAAISGGLDLEHDLGFYAGTWTSNVEFGGETGYELDAYGGYSGSAAGVDYDVGAIHYAYPLHDEADFTEVYVAGGYSVLSAGVAYTVDTDWGGDDRDLYYHGGLEFEAGEGLALGLVVGHYAFDDDAAEDYTHYQASVAKDDFQFAVDVNDLDGDDDPRVWAAWNRSFDLM